MAVQNPNQSTNQVPPTAPTTAGEEPPRPQEGGMAPATMPPVPSSAPPSPSPQAPPSPPKTPPVGPGPGAPPATAAPPTVEESGGGRKIPIKPIILAVVAVALVAVLVFLVKSFLPFGGEESESGEQSTLTYWGLWEESATIKQLIAQYEAQNSGVKINYVKQAPQDYRERLVNSLAKNAGPDIFRFHNTWVPTLTTQLDTLPSSVMSTSEFQETFYPVATRDLASGTGILGMPLMFDGLALYINEDIFNPAGKTAPLNWDELRKAALELTVKDESGRIQQAGAALGRADNVDHWQDILSLMMLQNGVDLAQPTGQLAEDALAFFAVFATTDQVWDETLPPSTQAFAAGKLAMYFGPSWRAFEIKQKNPSLSFKTVPVPQLPKGSPLEPDITWASYWVEGVWNKSKNREEAWKFLKFLSEKTSLTRIYQESSKTRLFGPVYPRIDMADMLKSAPYVGAYVNQAESARSWYLASRTFDGPSGINSRISAYFEDAVNGVVDNHRDPEDVLLTVAQGVAQVLSSYGR